MPALQFDDGDILTAGPAILQFLADAHPSAQLAPAVGTMARARILEQLTFTVRRQGFWNQWQLKLRESSAHLVGFIMHVP